MYASDVAHLETLGWSESMDSIWPFDFHLSEGGTWHVMI